jgi:hypothetical protein
VSRGRPVLRKRYLGQTSHQQAITENRFLKKVGIDFWAAINSTDSLMLKLLTTNH